MHGTSDTIWLALLRGINVGGRNVIRMAELRSCFEAEGFRDVVTYIQSGNVIFRSASSGPGVLTARIEEMLATSFGYRAKITLRSRDQMRAVVEGAPAGFGVRPDILPLRRSFSDASPDSGRRHGACQCQAGRRRSLGGRRCSLLLATHCQGIPEPPQPSRLDAGVPEHDDPQLEDSTTRLLQLMEGD